MNRLSIRYDTKWTLQPGQLRDEMDGVYFDPLHGRCLRSITKVTKQEYLITGVYGDDEMMPIGNLWYAHISVSSESDTSLELVVRFDGKVKDETKKVLQATFDKQSRSIRWEDRNVWFSIVYHPSIFRSRVRCIPHASIDSRMTI